MAGKNTKIGGKMWKIHQKVGKRKKFKPKKVEK